MDPQNLRNALAAAMQEGMTYNEYSAFNKQLAKEGKTTGPQKEAYVNYTKLGAARMKRWEKLYTPSQAFLQALLRSGTGGRAVARIQRTLVRRCFTQPSFHCEMGRGLGH
jgi:hypothetical protein